MEYCLRPKQLEVVTTSQSQMHNVRERGASSERKTQPLPAGSQASQQRVRLLRWRFHHALMDVAAVSNLAPVVVAGAQHVGTRLGLSIPDRFLNFAKAEKGSTW